MKINKLPPIEVLNEHFDYNPETGELRWKKPTTLWQRPGSIAGGLTKRGYTVVKFQGMNFFVHRIAWAMHHGKDPYPHIVDHKEGVENGNAISNLRLATHSDNTYNRTLRSDNTSGHRGVMFLRGKWQVQLGNRYIGVYNCKEDAIEARLKAEEENNIFVRD